MRRGIMAHRPRVGSFDKAMDLNQDRDSTSQGMTGSPMASASQCA